MVKRNRVRKYDPKRVEYTCPVRVGSTYCRFPATGLQTQGKILTWCGQGHVQIKRLIDYMSEPSTWVDDERVMEGFPYYPQR